LDARSFCPRDGEVLHGGHAEMFGRILDGQFASGTLPLDGSFRKLATDEKRRIEELRKEAAPARHSVRG
jgi:hypothetical protein